MANGVDWRADMRANDIARRPPPSGTREARPDRGYVEQPEERVDAEREQKKLERFSSPPRMVGVQPIAQPISAPPAPEPQPEAPLVLAKSSDFAREPASVAKVRKKRVLHARDVKVAAIARVLTLMANGEKVGAQVRVAREVGTHESNVSQWAAKEDIVRDAKKLNAASAPKPEAALAHLPTQAPAPVASAQQTLLSGPPSSSGALPPAPTLVVDGLEAYINALVDRRVNERFRAYLRSLGGE